MPRACWPPGKSTGPTCFTPGNFTWSSCSRLFCAKLKQCVVLACCILYKNPFPPTHCLKHLYKFYLNRKLEILFTICFSPKRASKINAQTLQEDINLTLTFFFFFFLKKKETAKLSLPNSTNKYGIEQKPIWKGSSVAQSVDPKNKLGFQNFLVFKLIYSIA